MKSESKACYAGVLLNVLMHVNMQCGNLQYRACYREDMCKDCGIIVCLFLFNTFLALLSSTLEVVLPASHHRGLRVCPFFVHRPLLPSNTLGDGFIHAMQVQNHKVPTSLSSLVFKSSIILPHFWNIIGLDICIELFFGLGCHMDFFFPNPIQVPFTGNNST